jgi:hypothetical protein
VKKAVKNFMLCMIGISIFAFNIVGGLSIIQMKAASSGTTYYVAANGKDDNDGLSPDEPLSYLMASGTTLHGGDSILFQRGDTFYGPFKPNTTGTSTSNRVTVGAYGSGDMPTLSVAKIVDKSWTQASAGFYKYNISGSGTYGGMQNGKTNVGFMEDSAGKKWGVRRLDASTCTGQYDFYCDNTYIYTKAAIDPHQALGRLTLGIDGVIVAVSSHMVVHEIRLRYCGGHGLNQASGNSTDVHITDCVIEDIGGGQLGTSGFTKYGNGIEFYGGAYDIDVERNIIRNTYDVGFTLQGGGDGIWSNITVKNNIFAYDTQACEVWTSGTNSNQGITGFNFTENICINQGEGWGTIARPDKFGGQGQVIMTNILFYGYDSPILDMTVSGNIFYNRNEANRVYSIASFGGVFLAKAKVNNNKIYLPNQTSICCSTDKTTGRYGGIALTFGQWQTAYGQDNNSTFTAISDTQSKYSSMENLALTSQAFSTILSAVNAAGIPISITVSAPTNTTASTTSATSTASTTSTTSTTASSTKSSSSKASTTVSNQGQSNTSVIGDTSSNESVASVLENESGETSSTSTSSKTSSITKGTTGMPTGAIVGIMFGALLLLAGGGIALYFLVIKKRML